jgi:anti-anti-sigma factor
VQNFDVTIDSMNGTAVVHPCGELDLASAPTLWAALAGTLEEGHRAVVMDLSRLTFSDCAGLRPVRRALRQGAAAGTDVALRDAVPAVSRVLELTGLRASPALA